MQMLYYHQYLCEESFPANELGPDDNDTLHEKIGFSPIKRFRFLLETLKGKLITILSIVFSIAFFCTTIHGDLFYYFKGIMCLCSKSLTLSASNEPAKAMFLRGYNRWPGHNESLLSRLKNQVNVPLLAISQ